MRKAAVIMSVALFISGCVSHAELTRINSKYDALVQECLPKYGQIGCNYLEGSRQTEIQHAKWGWVPLWGSGSPGGPGYVVIVP